MLKTLPGLVNRLIGLLVALLLISGFGGGVFAQSGPTGSLSGVVQDPSRRIGLRRQNHRRPRRDGIEPQGHGRRRRPLESGRVAHGQLQSDG